LAEKSLGRFRGTVETQLAGAESSLRGMLGTAAALATGFGAVAAVKWGVSVAAEAEQSLLVLETLLGSGDKARRMFADIQTLASKTAFSQGDLMKGSTQLLTAGFAEGDIKSVLTLLSDAASANPAGMAQGMEAMVGAISRIKTQGRLAGEQVQQLQQALIPISDILSKSLGKSVTEVKKMIESGAVDSQTAITAILSYSQSRFDGLAAKQSATLGGLWSTLKDESGNALGEIAAQLLKAFDVKDGLQGVIGFIGDIRANAEVAANQIAGFIKPIIESGRAVFDVFAEVVRQVFEVAEAFGLGETSTRTWRNAAIDSFEAVMGTAATVVDFVKFMFHVIDIGWQKSKFLFLAGVRELLAAVAEAQAATAFNAGLKNIFNATARHLHNEAAAFKQQADALNTTRDKLLDDLKSGQSPTVKTVIDWFSAFRQKDAAAQLQRDLEQIGQSIQSAVDGILPAGLTIRVKELQLAQGAVDPLAKQIEDDLAKRQAANAQEAESISDRVNPLQRLQKQMDKLNELVVSGKLGIQDYRRGVAELGDELIRMADLPEPKSAGAVLAGSQEAYSIAVQRALPQMSWEEKLVAAQQRLLEKLGIQNKIGEKTLDVLRQGLKPLPVVKA
jgi:tape measure domain-containing protein